MGISNLQGTPWHIEQAHRKEGDERRHKSRCVFYNPVTKQCKDRWKCKGSRYCSEYEPLSEEDFKQRQSDTVEAKKMLSNGYSENEIASFQAQEKKQGKMDSQKKTPAKNSVANNKKASIKDLPNLQGKSINHKGYGQGVVIEQTGDSILVNYGGIIKSQKLSILIKNKTVKYISQK